MKRALSALLCLVVLFSLANAGDTNFLGNASLNTAGGVQLSTEEAPPSGLVANGNYDDKIVLDWFPPNETPEYELFYDNGFNEIGGLGFWSGNPSFGWMVSRFASTGGPITITKIKLFITNDALEDDIFEIGVFADDGGVPTFTPLGVKSITQHAPFNEWFEWELDSPIELTNGIAWVGHRQITPYQGVCVGGDETSAFPINTFKYSYDGSAWTSFEPGLSVIPMQRCFAVGQFGSEIELCPSPIEVEPLPETVIEYVKGKAIMGVEVPDSWMTSSKDYSYDIRSIVVRAANAVAPHAPFILPVNNRWHGNMLDDVSYYIVYRDGIDVSHPTDEHYEDTGLQENTPHNYYVTAYYDNNIESEPAGPVTAACNMAPAAPANLNGTTYCHSMLLTWDDPTHNADGSLCTDLAGIEIYRGSDLISTVSPGVQQYLDTPPFGATLTWTVRAFDEVPNTSIPSNDFTGASGAVWNQVSYEWIDISSVGTELSMSDDDTQGPFNIGFDFPFMGETYSTLNIMSNGFVSFTSTAHPYNNTTLPDPDSPNGSIFPFWDDLDPADVSHPGQVHYYEDVVNNRFIVQWTNCMGLANAGLGPQTFQLILYPNGIVRFNYHTINGNTLCTVGAENAAGDEAVLVCHDGGGWLPESGTSLQLFVSVENEIAVVDVSAGIPLCACVQACQGNQTIVFAPLTEDQEPLSVRFDEGCDGEPFRDEEQLILPGYSCEETDCPPAYPDPVSDFYYSADLGGWCIDVVVGADGCYCVCIDDILPVELVGFEALAGNGSVTLNWTTASEVNNDHFEIERNSTVLGMVNANEATTGSHYSWTETNLTNGREYTYSLIAVSIEGVRETIGTVSATPTVGAATVTEYALYQNYPNPFNPETNIIFDIVEAGNVSLTVYNPLGQTVATLVNGTVQAGRHTISFNAENLPSGLYFYRLDAADFTAVKKMILMK